MYVTAIDKNALNGLFDNQKKLDDLFDSIFDEENFLFTSSSGANTKHSAIAEPLLKAQNPYLFMFPIVLEIAAIYLVVSNFL